MYSVEIRLKFYNNDNISMIRLAKSKDSNCLTKLSFASKRYWKYPKKYFEIWENELTISPKYILDNEVFVYEHGDTIIGYYSIVELKNDLEISNVRINKGFWLEHMFIEPQNIRTGIGTRLFDHLRERCVDKGIKVLGILADPNARGFYETMGCIYIEECPSTIKNRTTPFLQLQC